MQIPCANCLIVLTSISIGGARRDRTADLLRATQALSQLSYGPIQNTEKCDYAYRRPAAQVNLSLFCLALIFYQVLLMSVDILLYFHCLLYVYIVSDFFYRCEIFLLYIK